jgi:hypothetical protein
MTQASSKDQAHRVSLDSGGSPISRPRHAHRGGLVPADVGNAAQLRRWQRERSILEQEQRDRRSTVRGRAVWIVVVLLLLDLAVSLAVIFSFM